MGYAARQNVNAVERFMKRYFLAAKEVGALTRILCAKLEVDEKKRPGGRAAPDPAPRRPSRSRRKASRSMAGASPSPTPDVFVDDTRKLMRLFWLANERAARHSSRGDDGGAARALGA